MPFRDDVKRPNKLKSKSFSEGILLKGEIHSSIHVKSYSRETYLPDHCSSRLMN